MQGTVLQYDDLGNPISWLRSEPRFKEDLAKGEIRIIKIKDKWSVQFKQRLPEGKKPRTIFLEESIFENQGTTADGSSEVLSLFGKNVFDNPKPVQLIKHLISFNTSEDDIILDFFAGSGTTAHSTMLLNSEDSHHRRFIVVQLPAIIDPSDNKSKTAKTAYEFLQTIGKPNNLCEVSKERIRRAGKELHEQNNSLDIGFKVFKLDTSNIKKNLAIAGVKTALSAIPYVSFFATFCNEFINSNWQDRIEKTQKEMFERLTKLDEEFEEKLRNKPNISSVVGSIYQSALSDIEEDKIPLYINSLINAINNENLDNTKLHIFINYLKEISLMHVLALTYFSQQHYDNTTPQMNAFRMPTQEEHIARIIGEISPELVKDINIFDTIINDLNRKGLIKIARLRDLEVSSIYKLIPKQTTSLGDEFIKFFEENGD